MIFDIILYIILLYYIIYYYFKKQENEQPRTIRCLKIFNNVSMNLMSSFSDLQILSLLLKFYNILKKGKLLE